MKRLSWWFLGTTAFGVLLSLAVVHFCTPSVERVSSSTSSIELDKEYVDQFADRIKWLETLAYATLAGVIGLRWSRENLVNHVTVAVAGSSLACSLFNGFRAHDEVLQALRTHTPLLLGTTSSRLMIVFQFWFLVIAIALLAIRILSIPVRGPHKVAVVSILVLFASVNASAQEPARADIAAVAKDCASKWVSSHYQRTPTQIELDTFVTIVSGVAQDKKIDLKSQSGCAFSESVLDYVENGSYILNGDLDYKEFVDFATDLARAISAHGLADSPFKRALWSMVEIWHQPRGVLRVESVPPGEEVFLEGTERGFTPFTCAIAPRKYQLQIKHDGVVVHNEQIEITDGQEVLRSIH